MARMASAAKMETRAETEAIKGVWRGVVVRKVLRISKRNTDKSVADHRTRAHGLIEWTIRREVDRCLR